MLARILVQGPANLYTSRATESLTLDLILPPCLLLRSIDTDELKQLLRKHNSAFTEEEIVEIGDLFYAGKVSLLSRVYLPVSCASRG